ncbi:hypothetical protein AA313_de0204303 [Arthrobotrys entomopaga]|nr:hypothetical protein AA313_de0204303 [Arthrobotrys entomopaga]
MAGAFWLRNSIPPPASSSSSSGSRRNLNTRRQRDNLTNHHHNHVDSSNSSSGMNNVGEKTSLLSASTWIPEYTGLPSFPPPPPPPPNPDSNHNNVVTTTCSSSIHWRLRLRYTLFTLLLLSIITPFYNLIVGDGWPFPPIRRPNPLHPPSNPTPPPIDPSLKSLTFSYGLSLDSSYYTYLLNISEQINPTHFPAGISGDIHILTGEEYQPHPIQAYIQISSRSSTPLSRIHPSHNQIPSGPENLILTSSSPKNTTTPEAHSNPQNDEYKHYDGEEEEEEEFPITITIYIYTRPRVVLFSQQGVHITSHTLNISIAPATFFETYRMSITSTHGNIHSGINPPHLLYFTAHSLSATTLHGNITGTWSLPSSISLSTPGGWVDVDVYPKLWSVGSWTKGDIRVHALRDVRVHMPFRRDLLSLRNGTVDVMSEEGGVDVEVVHGAVTNITALRGGIKGRVLPFWSIWQFQRDIYPPVLETWSAFDTELTVEMPCLDPPVMEGINGLEMVKGRHVSSDGGDGGGVVVVRYPIDGWKGKARVESGGGDGKVGVILPDGVDDEGRIVREEGKGVVRWEGEEGKSVVDVRGAGEVRFELWREERRTAMMRMFEEEEEYRKKVHLRRSKKVIGRKAKMYE